MGVSLSVVCALHLHHRPLHRRRHLSHGTLHILHHLDRNLDSNGNESRVVYGGCLPQHEEERVERNTWNKGKTDNNFHIGHQLKQTNEELPACVQVLVGAYLAREVADRSFPAMFVSLILAQIARSRVMHSFSYLCGKDGYDMSGATTDMLGAKVTNIGKCRATSTLHCSKNDLDYL